jgi:hypothetical protein
LGVPTDAVRPVSQCNRMGDRSRSIVAIRAQVASLTPQDGPGGSVRLSKRIQDQTAVRKLEDKDNDKAGRKGEAVDLRYVGGECRRE